MKQTSIPSLFLPITLLSLGAMATTGSAQVIDLFDDADLSEYTRTVILNNTDTTANISFASPSGGLQVISAGSTQPEQVLFLRDDFTLGVGQTLRIDAGIVSAATAINDFGLAIATTETPLGVAPGANGDTRLSTSFLTIAIRASANDLRSSGSNTTAIFTTAVAATVPENTVTGLFITRLTPTTYDLGYFNAGGSPVIVVNRTVPDTNLGNAVGFYADIRADMTVGVYDNLQIVPEPGSVVMLVGGLGMLGLVRRRSFRQ